jgi:rubrerythrin
MAVKAAGTASSRRYWYSVGRQNLATAMRSEAFAHARYLLFARQARADGHDEPADLLEHAAQACFERFAAHGSLTGALGSDAANVHQMVWSEKCEVPAMYHTFAQEAARAGERELADHFTKMAARGAKLGMDLEAGIQAVADR